MRMSWVKLVALTTVPAVKAPIIKLALAAPAETSITTVVASDLKIRAKVGVIAATAVPAVMALAVSRPLTAAGNAVAPKVRVTPSVLPARAASAVAGCVPS